jgi:hypothetical protein
MQPTTTNQREPQTALWRFLALLLTVVGLVGSTAGSASAFTATPTVSSSDHSVVVGAETRVGVTTQNPAGSSAHLASESPACVGENQAGYDGFVLVSCVATNTPSRSGVLSDLDAGLTAQIRKTAGFSDNGVPIIVDESLNIPGGPAKVAAELRAAGYNARAVREFAPGSTPDSKILGVADAVNGRVLAVDRGRQLDGGFGSRAVQVPHQIRTVSDVIRILQGAGL